MTPQRPLFWNVEGALGFYALAAVALGICGWGVARHVRVWLRGPSSRGWRLSAGDLGALVRDGLLGRRLLRGDVAAGVMHALVFWGFTGLFAATVASAIDHYVVTFLRGSIYLVYAAAAEAAGLMLVVGLVWALARRAPRLERRARDLVPILWLLLVAATGFLVEGLRLAMTEPPWAEWSIAREVAAELHDGVGGHPWLYPISWWLHALVSLALIALLPFTKLFHALAAPASVVLARQGPVVEPAELAGPAATAPTWSLRERVFLDACTRCGRCDEVCPATRAGEPFSPRAILAAMRELMWREAADRVAQPATPGRPGGAGPLPPPAASAWHCTGCRACLETCPIYVSTPDAVRELRRRLVEEGTGVPPSLSQALAKLHKYDNPWEASKKGRAQWLRGLDVADLSREPDSAASGAADAGRWCYFVGCTTAVETRAQAVARALVQLLQHAEVPFGILGKKEPCCGDIARRVGEDGLFAEKAESCLELFARLGISRLVTSSPHCRHAFRTEYPLLSAAKAAGEPGANAGRTPPEAWHYAELLADLLATGSLCFAGRVAARVAFHDPCYLGRHAGLYEPPRRVLRAIPGLELVELEHHGPQSLCCGGGGGRLWQPELPAEAKMAEIRVREAAAVEADILVTACPLCLIMLDDARKTAGLAEELEVLDLSELGLRALEPAREPVTNEEPT